MSTAESRTDLEQKTNTSKFKIYTKRGDSGTTTLLGSSERVLKSDHRVKAYGAVDELNAHLGRILAILNKIIIQDIEQHENRILFINLIDDITNIQRALFIACSWLALSIYGHPAMSRNLGQIHDFNITMLEIRIDQMTEKLPALKNFILCRGEGTAEIHIGRTVCRRAECCVVKSINRTDFIYDSSQYDLIATYLNRLSDWLFTLARYHAHLTSQEEVHV